MFGVFACAAIPADRAAQRVCGPSGDGGGLVRVGVAGGRRVRVPLCAVLAHRARRAQLLRLRPLPAHPVSAHFYFFSTTHIPHSNVLYPYTLLVYT